MNLSAYPKTRRAPMSAADLVRLYGRCTVPSRAHDWLDRVAPLAAAVFEIPDSDETAALIADASEIAADFCQPLSVRRLAATVALAAESVLVTGLCDWDRALDWLNAAEMLNIETRPHG